jgi:8-oxo-dGTP diphosphatase
MKRVDVVYALIINEDNEKVLMVKNKPYNNWTLPGGSVEKGETLELAVVREVKEETGLTVEIGQLLAVNEAFRTRANNHVLFITFNAEVVAGELMIQDTDDVSEVEWIDIHRANELLPYFEGGIQKLVESSIPYTYQGVQA